jgi:putative SOS response-associated peptidase YedK
LSVAAYPHIVAAMCGRFTRYLPWPEIVRLYRLTLNWEINKNTAPAYNIAPTVEVPFVTADGETANQRLREGRWWLVPWWAKEMPKAGNIPLCRACSRVPGC